MSRVPRIEVEIVDVNGSFKRFLQQSPRVFRDELTDAVKATAFSLSRRMEVLAPVGPDAPHIREAISYKARGLTAQVGILDDEGDKPSADGATTTQAEVALYNEYAPNKQPFEGPAARAETGDFLKRITRGLQRAERSLSGGVGI